MSDLNVQVTKKVWAEGNKGRNTRFECVSVLDDGSISVWYSAKTKKEAWDWWSTKESRSPNGRGAILKSYGKTYGVRKTVTRWVNFPVEER